MVSSIVTENISALKNSPQTFESIYTIIKNRFTSETFGEWLEDGNVCKMSYYELYERVDEFSKAAAVYGAGGSTGFVGIFLENSADWVALFWGLLQAGFKPILLNTRHNISITNEIIKDMDPVFVVSEDDRVDKAVSVKDLLAAGKGTKFDKSMIKWADEIILITSGSTSKPKIISHSGKTICLQVEMSEDIVRKNQSIQYNAKLDIHNLAFLPFYHIFGLIATLMWFMFFGRGFVFLPKYDAQSIQYVCKRIGVTHFFAIPLVWNKTVASLEREVAKQGKTEKFNKAIKFSNKLQNVLPLLGPIIVRKIIFKKVREGLGGQMKFFVGGGALLDIDLQRYYCAIGIPMYQGYGLSEATPIISANAQAKHIFGSSGKVVQPMEIKILDADGNELPFGEKGEICIKGENVMAGYWKNPKSTADTIIDGWLHTGDMGYMRDEEMLYVVGRFKSLLIAADGEKYSPEGIEENLVESSKFIDGALLHNSQDPYTIALITPNKDALKAYAKELGLDPKSDEAKVKMLEKLQEEVDMYRPGGRLNGMFPERWLPAAVCVLPEPWTEQNHFLNSSMKVVRGRVEEAYKEHMAYAYTTEGKNIVNPKNLASL